MSGFIPNNSGGGGGGPPTGAAGGNLSGSYPNPTVAKINGSSVPAGGSLTTGNLLQVTGVSTVSYNPLNLAGGSSFITGTIPNSNLPDATTGAKGIIQLTGDISGSASSVSVIKINSTSVPSSPSANQILVATNSTTSVWSQIYDGYVASSANITGSKIASATTGVVGVIQLAGDIAGTATSITVTKIQNRSINSSTPSDGYVLTWVDSDSYWAPRTGGGSGFTAGGDLSGTSSSQTVIKINGSTVPSGGSLTTGNILQVSGAGALSYSALNLAGGSNYVIGTLPTSNQASQTLGGDLSGTTASATVAKINGTSVNATPSANTVLVATSGAVSIWSQIYDGYVASSAAISGSKIDPAFGSQAVSTTGTLSSGATTINNATANSTALTVQTNSSTRWEIGNDASGAFIRNSSSSVATSGLIRTTNNVTVIASRNAANNANGALLTYNSSDQIVVGNTNDTIIVNSGGNAIIQTSGTNRIWVTSASVLVGSQVLDFDQSIGVAFIRFAQKIADVAPTTFLLRAQAAFGSASTNKSGGNLEMQSGERTNNTGLYGKFQVSLGNNNGVAQFEVGEVTANNTGRYISMFRGAAMTTTQMPANTGDLVEYMGEAAIEPTANPVSGAIRYVSGGNTYQRTTSGQVQSVLGSYISRTWPSDANYTAVLADYRCKIIEVTGGGLTATRDLILPLIAGYEFLIKNSTTIIQSIRAIGSSGTGVTIVNGTTVRVWTDGTNYYQESAAV